MELEERKLKILNAIIKSYLETGEPVGSRTVSKMDDINLSSATIRNEMADLEEMGYIIQPHTSSGRIPSDAGYRLYVDKLMEDKKKELDKKEQDLNDMKDFLDDKVDRVEMLLENTAKLLANSTNYATLVTSPVVKKSKKIKFIQLSLMDSNKLLCVIVTEGNVIKNRIINLENAIDNEEVLKLNLLFNSSLNGLAFEDINIGIISAITEQGGENANLVRDIIDIIGLALTSNEDFKIYTSGATNIFKYPELTSGSTASTIINMFEEKNLLTTLLDKDEENDNDDDIQIYIGSESPVSSMKDCSIVTATYEIDEDTKGTIGILGPKRMDYEKVMEALDSVKHQLDKKFKKHKQNDDTGGNSPNGKDDMGSGRFSDNKGDSDDREFPNSGEL